MGQEMIREFKYRGETFRVNAHGVAGHEEVFIIHLVDGEEIAEISIDRMTEENDTSAPIEAICVMLCDKLIAEENMDCADASGGFAWVEGARARDVLPSNKRRLLTERQTRSRLVEAAFATKRWIFAKRRVKADRSNRRPRPPLR